MRNNYFCIAGLYVCIRFADEASGNMSLLPSFSVFATDSVPSDGQLLFTLAVDEQLQPKKDKQLIRNFDTGNGDTRVYLLSDGGYQFIVRDIYDRDCCLLIANKGFSDCRCALNGDFGMRSFGLNDALMLVYAFAGSYRQAMLIHASCVMRGDTAYPFIAESGTGKSTHVALWLKHIEGTELLNDDNPVIRIESDGKPYIYGSPWSGKTPCYRNRRAHLGAVTRIDRAPKNSIEQLPPVAAFASVLPACSSMKWDPEIYNNLCDAVTRIIETTPVYTLHCRPDEEAARVSYAALVKDEE